MFAILSSVVLVGSILSIFNMLRNAADTIQKFFDTLVQTSILFIVIIKIIIAKCEYYITHLCIYVKHFRRRVMMAKILITSDCQNKCIIFFSCSDTRKWQGKNELQKNSSNLV